MIINHSNLYIKEKPPSFVLCLEMPDSSRNYLHTPQMSLGGCISAMDDIVDFKIENVAEVSLEYDAKYYRIQILIPNKQLSSHEHLVFHSRKLNLNDAIKERQMMLD